MKKKPERKVFNDLLMSSAMKKDIDRAIKEEQALAKKKDLPKSKTKK